MDLRGATVLVTGPTRGIGEALARRLVAEGAHVVGLARDPDRLAAMSAALHGSFTPLAVDLAAPAEVDAAIAMVVQRHPTLSVLVNNAGVQVNADFVSGEALGQLRELRVEIAVNFDAVVTLCAGLLPHLARQPAAAIVNVTSGLALAPKASAPVYCATKAAVRAFTRALRYQCEHMAPHVTVTDAVMPLVDTDMTRGRGGGKMTPAAAAGRLIRGLQAGSSEIYVGKAALLAVVLRVAPALAHRALRGS